MKYWQPYGISDPNASYINGNPATGTPGSIPPAQSIEHPQREIVAVIAGARQTPDANSVSQMAFAIQSGQLIYALDAGTPNHLSVTTSPNFGGSFITGLVIVVKVANTNTGPCDIAINGAGVWPIVHASGFTPLNALDFIGGQMVALAFDGTNFQYVWNSRQPGSPVFLTGPRDYYVNGTTGDDTYDGLAATLTGGHGPFKTLQKAADQIPLFNLNSYNITVHVADGTYGPRDANFPALAIPKINGSGSIAWVGNTSNPALCSVECTYKTAILVPYIGGQISFDGFKVVSNGPSIGQQDGMCGILAVGAGTVVQIGAMVFGACQGAHLSFQQGAQGSNLTAGCVWNIQGGSESSNFLPGAFMYNYMQGNFIPNGGGGPAIYIPSAVAFGAAPSTGHFAYAAHNSFLHLVYQSLTGAGVAGVTGTRYGAHYNSSILTAGGGANYFPGSVAGTTSNGGYYT